MAKLTTYQVTEIAKDTWVINEAGMTDMFLLKGTERALLIDTGVDGDGVLIRLAGDDGVGVVLVDGLAL